MDHTTLHKKLSTYLTDTGRLQNLPDDLLCEVLHNWEQWPGKAKDFYKSVGFSQKQLATIIGKAKKLKRDGYFPVENFAEIKVEDAGLSSAISSSMGGIELEWQPGKIIRFPEVRQLIEFLKLAG